MASFPVSRSFGEYLRNQGYIVIPNDEVGKRKRPSRVVIQATGKEAKRRFNAIFWATHRLDSTSSCPCCYNVVRTY